MSNYITMSSANAPIKLWAKGVPVGANAEQQLRNMASMPFIAGHIAVMPDVHLGMGATIGSVIPTSGAIIPAAVGVDIGCGMMAVRTSLTAHNLPDGLSNIRSQIEAAVPHGRTKGGGRNDRGSFGKVPTRTLRAWRDQLSERFEAICDKHRRIKHSNSVIHLGTLGSGNHFIELCLDEADRVWVMLHSGSRGVGNRIGSHFIELAKKDCRRQGIGLVDHNLAYLQEGAEHFDDYVQAVGWAQDFARLNRELMMSAVLRALAKELPKFQARCEAVNCHHNYIARETHFGRDVWVTRKGAVRAGVGEMGIIPGSMGTRSYIVRGKGNVDSFSSCSHGAGRLMSRSQAKQQFTLADHRAATQHVECRKDKHVLDETPMAYKDIDAVMAAQSDLVEIAHTLRQVVCVKG